MRQEEAAHEPSTQEGIHGDMKPAAQASNSERVQQVVPAVHSQHETFKCASHIAGCRSSCTDMLLQPTSWSAG